MDAGSCNGCEIEIASAYARGLSAQHLIEEAARSTMDELASWTVESDQVLTF